MFATALGQWTRGSQFDHGADGEGVCGVEDGLLAELLAELVRVFLLGLWVVVAFSSE